MIGIELTGKQKEELLKKYEEILPIGDVRIQRITHPIIHADDDIVLATQRK